MRCLIFSSLFIYFGCAHLVGMPRVVEEEEANGLTVSISTEAAAEVFRFFLAKFGFHFFSFSMEEPLEMEQNEMGKKRQDDAARGSVFSAPEN